MSADPSPLSLLRVLSPTSGPARQLRLVAIDIIESKQPIPLRGAKINFTWLAATIGMTRQVFYPGRGSPELMQVADLLLEYVQSKPSHTKVQAPYDRTLAGLRTEIELQRRRSLELERALSRAQFRENIIRAGGILTF
jgi:hypothetical protein